VHKVIYESEREGEKGIERKRERASERENEREVESDKLKRVKRRVLASAWKETRDKRTPINKQELGAVQ
jgi:hypothetical protein